MDESSPETHPPISNSLESTDLTSKETKSELTTAEVIATLRCEIQEMLVKFPPAEWDTKFQQIIKNTPGIDQYLGLIKSTYQMAKQSHDTLTADWNNITNKSQTSVLAP